MILEKQLFNIKLSKMRSELQDSQHGKLYNQTQTRPQHSHKNTIDLHKLKMARARAMKARQDAQANTKQ